MSKSLLKTLLNGETEAIRHEAVGKLFDLTYFYWDALDGPECSNYVPALNGVLQKSKPMLVDSCLRAMVELPDTWEFYAGVFVGDAEENSLYPVIASLKEGLLEDVHDTLNAIYNEICESQLGMSFVECVDKQLIWHAGAMVFPQAGFKIDKAEEGIVEQLCTGMRKAEKPMTMDLLKSLDVSCFRKAYSIIFHKK